MQHFYRLTLLLFAGCLTQTSFSQNPGCDGIRYKNDVFATAKKSTVVYAPSINQAGQPVDLHMDVYEPVGDAVAMRPVVILEHGGSFILGDKTDMKSYCELLAKQGYVAATIEYRLYPFFLLGFPDSLDIMDTAVKAVADMKAAIRYFREDAATTNTFRADPNHIYIGGYSAGAVAALHTAYMDPNDILPSFLQTILNNNDGWVGNSGTPANKTYPSDIKAVLNMSGGLYRSEWVDSSEVPLVSIHGTNDGTVDYVSGLAAGIAYLQGSSLVHARANEVGVWNYLETVQGGGHTDTYEQAQYAPQVKSFWSHATTLLESLTCEAVTDVDQINTTPAGNMKIIPNPVNGQFLRIETDGAITQGRVDVFDATGRRVMEKTNWQNNVQIELPQLLPAGLYTLRVTDALNPALSMTKQFLHL